MRVVTAVQSTLVGWWTRGLALWGMLSPRNRWIVGGGAGAVVLGIAALLLFTGGRPCGVREDVEARVAALSAQNQADAASGRIAISKLAERTKTLNAAATAFEKNKDLRAYCEALDGLSEDFKAPF